MYHDRILIAQQIKRSDNINGLIYHNDYSTVPYEAFWDKLNKSDKVEKYCV